MNYEIRRDGYVYKDGKMVGECVTGEDGYAYVEFFEGCAPEPGDHWFECKLGERQP